MKTSTWHHPLGDLFNPMSHHSLSISTTRAPLCCLRTSENERSKCKPDRWSSSLTWARLWPEYTALLLKPYSWLFTPAPLEVRQIIQLLFQKKKKAGGKGTCLNVRRARQVAGQMKKKVVKYLWDGEKKQLSVNFVKTHVFFWRQVFCEAVSSGCGPTQKT